MEPQQINAIRKTLTEPYFWQRKGKNFDSSKILKIYLKGTYIRILMKMPQKKIFLKYQVLIVYAVIINQQLKFNTELK